MAQTRDQDASRPASTEPVLEDALVIRGTGRRWMEGETLSSRDLTVIETLHRVSISPGHSMISVDDKE